MSDLEHSPVLGFGLKKWRCGGGGGGGGSSDPSCRSPTTVISSLSPIDNGPKVKGCEKRNVFTVSLMLQIITFHFRMVSKLSQTLFLPNSPVLLANLNIYTQLTDL